MPSQKKPKKFDVQMLRDLVQTCFLGVFFVILFALNGAWYFWSIIVFVVYCMRCNSLSSAILKEAFVYAAVAGGIFWTLSILSQWWELYAVWLFVGIGLSFFVRATSEGLLPWGKTVQDQMGRFLGNIEAKIVDALGKLLSQILGDVSENSVKADEPLSKAKKSTSPQKKRKPSRKLIQ